jgi:hypothetical protein
VSTSGTSQSGIRIDTETQRCRAGKADERAAVMSYFEVVSKLKG